MEMKVWVCETWETDGYDTFGEWVTLWHNEEDATKHGQEVADSCTAQYIEGRFRVWEASVQ